jgi:uncharacterized protein (TIGR00369 family)
MSAAPSADRLRLDVAGLNAFLDGAFPQREPGAMGTVVEARPGFVRLQMQPGDWALRPGGLISGPTQMGLVDGAAYVLVAAHLGPVEMAVTSALNMQFLRPCRPGVLSADANLLKLGRRLVNMDVRLWTDNPDRPVAHATVTYALP